jgi:hypothetical protein
MQALTEPGAPVVDGAQAVQELCVGLAGRLHDLLGDLIGQQEQDAPSMGCCG